MKLGPVWKMVIVVALGGAAVWAVSYIEHTPPQRLVALLGFTVSVSDSTATPKPTQSPSDRLSPIDGDSSSTLGTVAVQTFSGPVLVRQGAGTAVSADGLALTTVAAAPYGSGSFVYQIATPRGQILRARRVASDQATGLVLLKAEANDLNAVLFSQDVPLSAGMQLEAVSAKVIASRFVPMRLPVWVVWFDEGRQTVLSMDRAYTHAFNGARLIDASGRSIGLVRNAIQPGLITAAQINAFLERYLGQAVKN